MTYMKEQLERAEKLYQADCKEMYANGYSGDFGTGLNWVMATYNPECWLEYFEVSSGDTET